MGSATTSAPRRGRRRGRLALGLLSIMAGGAAAIAPFIPSGDLPALAEVVADTRPFFLAAAACAIVVGLGCLLTSRRPAPPPAPPASSGTAFSPRGVFDYLRADGWYVADNVSLPKAFADHVAVGPAGVFVVQILWTDLEAQQGDPLARARIASWQLRTVLQNQELAVEVVPVVLVWGPTLGQGEAATEVVDSVLVLVGSRTHEWLPDLIGQRHLDSGTVELVRSAIAGVWPATARATLPV